MRKSTESDAKNKGKYEKVEPGLYKYRKTGEFCSILKVDGKVKYKMLGVTDKPTARRLLAEARNDTTSLDPNLSGLGLSPAYGDVPRDQRLHPYVPLEKTYSHLRQDHLDSMVSRLV